MSAPNHQWPGTKKKQKLRPSISFLVVSRRIKKILADNYREFPVAHQWHHPLKEDHVFNVPRHPWPRTEKKQKLQPSISVLVVFGRINKITADNYREFPVAHQWQHLIKPGQCNVPKHPWPRTKNCSHRSLCPVVSGTATMDRKRGIHPAKRPQLSGEREHWEFQNQRGMQHLQQEPESHCAESPAAKVREETKNCSHRSFSWWSLGESLRSWQTIIESF